MQFLWQGILVLDTDIVPLSERKRRRCRPYVAAVVAPVVEDVRATIQALELA